MQPERPSGLVDRLATSLDLLAQVRDTIPRPRFACPGLQPRGLSFLNAIPFCHVVRS